VGDDDEAVVTAPRCEVVKAPAPEPGVTGLSYNAGVTAQTAGASALCLQIVTIAPGARGKAHLHENHESALYVVSGQAVMWFGERLEEAAVAEAGDFVYVPPGVPHVPANYGDAPVTAVLARTDPNAQESVVLRPDLNDLPQLASPPAR
jgi:uncharacterized RmlC-like cupin family protein